MKFSTETKVKDIALSNPSARQILEDAGVDYCCGGGKSLHDACTHAAAGAEEILRRLHENSRQVSPEEANWVAAPLSELTRHIRTKHHHYVREAIARLRPLLEKVKTKHGENHPEVAQIERLFAEVGREMTMHMQKEEQILFPYIDAVEKSANTNTPLEPPFFGTVQNPIHAMMKEHDSAGDLVKQIRKASGDYTPPSDACTSYRALYQDLREFEADLHQHVHLENNILFPRAVELEAAVAHQE
ncbi:MAG: iron-sulfur cluster repair di-iron protein [Candidatus Acidiferrales bacterium]